MVQVTWPWQVTENWNGNPACVKISKVFSPKPALSDVKLPSETNRWLRCGLWDFGYAVVCHLLFISKHIAFISCSYPMCWISYILSYQDFQASTLAKIRGWDWCPDSWGLDSHHLNQYLLEMKYPFSSWVMLTKIGHLPTPGYYPNWSPIESFRKYSKNHSKHKLGDVEKLGHLPLLNINHH